MSFIQTSLFYFIIMFYLMLWKIQDKLLVYSVVYSYTHLINVISLSFLTELWFAHTPLFNPLQVSNCSRFFGGGAGLTHFSNL